MMTTALEKLQEDLMEVHGMGLGLLAVEAISESPAGCEHKQLLQQISEKVSKAADLLNESDSLISEYMVNTFTS